MNNWSLSECVSEHVRMRFWACRTPWTAHLTHEYTLWGNEASNGVIKSLLIGTDFEQQVLQCSCICHRQRENFYTHFYINSSHDWFEGRWASMIAIVDSWLKIDVLMLNYWQYFFQLFSRRTLCLSERLFKSLSEPEAACWSWTSIYYPLNARIVLKIAMLYRYSIIRRILKLGIVP